VFRFFVEIIRLFWILAREGVISMLPVQGAPWPVRISLKLLDKLKSKKKEAGSQLPNALQRLGPSYIKMGQFLATRPDIVGLDMARDLAVLQDQMPPFSQKEALRQIEIHLGQPWHEIYDEISEPVAAASVAQVHKAKVKGEGPYNDVAIKILRPDVERRFKNDIKVMRRIAKVLSAIMPMVQRLKPVETVDLMQSWIRHELDLRLEAGALSEFADSTEKDGNIRVPGLDWSRSAKGVLTLEWIDGHRIDNLEALKTHNIEPAELGNMLIISFLHHALRDGYFHADMHPGNLMIDEDGKVVVLDFGIMGRIGRKERRFLAEILFGFITRDYLRIAQVHFEAGYVPATESVEEFAQALRAVGEPIHNQRADQISMARLLTLLFEITDLFNMVTRLELLLLQKTMVAVEGIARMLNPEFNMWQVSEPVIRQWLTYHLGPQGRLLDIKESVQMIYNRTDNLPQKINFAFEMLEQAQEMSQKGVKIDLEALSALSAQKSSSKSTDLAIWALAASIFFTGSVLLAQWLW